MDGDPEELLLWLKTDENGDRDLQIAALEQLCMLLLMSDNIDRCFEQYQPRLFLPALCDIFNDTTAPPNVLEITARALTYFLDVSIECAKKITSHESVIRSMCRCLETVDIEDRTNRDLAEQIIKVFERICSREASSIYENDGLRCVLDFINHCHAMIHKDSLQSALHVVVKLIGKIDPQNATTLDQIVESLSKLLLHENTSVSDNALRCFATLADRFARKSIDPEPLMRYGLKDVLLRSLHDVSKPVGHRTTSDSAVPSQPTAGQRGITTNISVVTGLLAALCRASAKVTEDLLCSNLLDALGSALSGGDERCVLDTMHFVDLLITLLFEGRPASARSLRTVTTTVSNTNDTGAEQGSKSSNSNSDQHQKQIIENIRSRNYTAFVNYIEQNDIDVNYTDYVGQTILNWVSAFGTKEMVEYLCQRGADVNRGQRSSSLHYAASFGRASIMRILLKYGANLDLRDEDGRTPMDKARERSEDNHQEILDILQSAQEWFDAKSSFSNSSLPVQRTEIELEMQSKYFSRLLAMFCQLYQKTMILTIKRSTLRLISKLIQYASIDQIHAIPFLTNLFELLATILDIDEDEILNMVLLLIKTLFEKDRQGFVEKFQYLGLISKISALAADHSSVELESKASLPVKIQFVRVDLQELAMNRLYLWREYQLLRNRECLYIWNSSLIIELSLGSNGWFRYFINNSLLTMYSSGTPENSVDTDENRQDFLEKFQRLRKQLLDELEQDKNDEKHLRFQIRVLFSTENSQSKTIHVGSWMLRSNESKQLRILNEEGDQATILESEQTHFIFISNRGSSKTYTAETPLNADFEAPWLTIDSLQTSKKFNSVGNSKNKNQATRQRTGEIARFIYEEYIQKIESPNYTRAILEELKSLVQQLNKPDCELEIIFRKLKSFFLEETSLSIYELASSGLVEALLNVFQDVPIDKRESESNETIMQRVNIFFSIFLADENPEAFQNLVRKFVLLMESIEKSPLYLYDNSLNVGLHIFAKRFHFRIQYRNEQQLFIDRTEKSINMEPLATVGQLKKFLASMVSKPWYEYPHQHLEFVKQLNSQRTIKFQYNTDFDHNGIFYWIATNGKTISQYTNPHLAGLISVTCPEQTLNPQQISSIISHQESSGTSNEVEIKTGSIQIDTGLNIVPTHITLRHRMSSPEELWTASIQFQMSADSFRYVTLESQLITDELKATASWKFQEHLDSSIGYRYLRIVSTSGQPLVTISGVEIYGTVLSSVDIRTKIEFNRSRSVREDNRARSNRNSSSIQHQISITHPRSKTIKSEHYLTRSTIDGDSETLSELKIDRIQSLVDEHCTTTELVDQVLSQLNVNSNETGEGSSLDDHERLQRVINEALLKLDDISHTFLNRNETSENPMQTETPEVNWIVGEQNSGSIKNESPTKAEGDPIERAETPVSDSTLKVLEEGVKDEAESTKTQSVATEENNKKNTTAESSEIINEPELGTPAGIDIVQISNTEQKIPSEDTSDEDEEMLFKRLQSNQQQIDPSRREEDDDEDGEQEEQEEQEEYNDEFQEHLHGQQETLTQRNWNDDFVLKRQFSVLLPAFDGRPGRSNVNATQDIPVPTNTSPLDDPSANKVSISDSLAASKMKLYLRGPQPNLNGLLDSSIELQNMDATIFDYVQQLIKPFPSSSRLARIEQIFEPKYTIIYRDISDDERRSKQANPTDVVSLLTEEPSEMNKLSNILNLLTKLYDYSQFYLQQNVHAHDPTSIEGYFQSKKLNNKLMKQMEDSMVTASSSCPRWTSCLTNSYRFLFSLEIRQLYFRTTSFGTSRSIVLLQERREELMRLNRQGRARAFNENSANNAPQEFRFGRLKIDRVTPINRQEILRDANNVFHAHANRKSKLEIQFLDEEGTGDGPTLDFYGLLAHELQRSSLGLWWHEEHPSDSSPHEFVNKREGLFPAPYPQTHEKLSQIVSYFSLMGIFFAKGLMDRYLIDMPLSISFLKLLCSGTSSTNKNEFDDEHCFDGILDLNDLIQIEPTRGTFFKNALKLIEQRRSILDDPTKSDEEKIQLCNNLKIQYESGTIVDVEHLCLNFVYTPPSQDYGYESFELIPNGAHVDVTAQNLEEYVRLSMNFILRDGIRGQMNAFRNGFNQVFSLDHLKCFSPSELRLVLCGNQWPSWTREDLLTFVEPTHGFTRESPGYVKFLNVMLALDGNERKSVVRFITGCSSLPPGGLANLRPRLSVARKVEAADSSYPSVNTCHHYLKLPEYSSEEILKTRLMHACLERGFYLN